MSIRGVAALACALFACSFDGSSPPGSIGDAAAPLADGPASATDARLAADADPGCADGDDDGYLVALSDGDCGAELDCDDADPRAFPGQRLFFATPRPSGSFDFDCDGDEEPASDRNGFDCQVTWDGCVGTGWLDDAPACGDAGTFHECGVVGLACREVESAETEMSCR